MINTKITVCITRIGCSFQWQTEFCNKVTKSCVLGVRRKQKMAEYMYTYADDDTAEQLLEAFRLYGTKNEKYTARYLSLIFVLSDVAQSFYLTRAAKYCHPEWTEPGDPYMTEYALVCGDAVSLVRCVMIPSYKPIEINHERHSLYYLELYEIQEILGENRLSEAKLEEIIRFYEGEGIKHKAAYSHIFDEQCLNIARQRELMLRKRTEWETCNELLVKDYHFHSTDDQCRQRLEECFERYGNNFCDGRNFKLRYAMTDGRRSFDLTLCYYLTDGIKHCSEPDDYEYAIVTDTTMGVVYVWNPRGDVEIKEIRGEIPLTEEKLCEAINYYEIFHSYLARKSISKKEEV